MRYVLDFGAVNAGQTPPGFGWFRDAQTHADLPAPTIFAETAPAWTYYFDFTFPPGTSPNTTAIEYGVTLNGVGLTDVISNAPVAPTQAQPLSNSGAGGPQTLAQLRDLIRSESDTENDPNITDPELTIWINQSRFRLYGKLVTAFGEDYYVSKAQFTTDGINQAVPLPDGILYGGAAPFFKGELLEVIQGSGASPQAPISLRKFMLRAKNRFNHPQALVASPSFFPRYRIVGSNIEFNILPAAGLVCRLWYAPKLSQLVQDADVADDMNGWLEFVVLDCVIKAIGKQERDASLHVARKSELTMELEREIANRDLGEPNTVVETENEGGPFGMPVGGAFGGYY
jgi:hypothetical protein